jgi:DMSO/TMAO reductase YedYZ molybdopterin-dependent catalytic subunit
MAPSIYATPQASLSPTGTPTPVPTPTTVPDTTGVLTIDGHVKVPMDLTMYDLSQFPQISILDHTYGAHQQLFQMNASGPSLNDILNMAQPNSNALVATFYGTDGYDATMLLSQIRSDPDAIIATQWNTTDNSSAAGNGLRDVLPSQYYAEYWVYYLDKITIQ